MPTVPPPNVPPAAGPRRWRRTRRGVLWSVAGLATAGAGLWMARVSLVNAALGKFAQARVSGIEWRPGGAVVLRGVEFSKAGTAEPVFRADTLTSRASLTDLRAGKLGHVILENPVLIWPAAPTKKEPSPTSPKTEEAAGAAARPLISWDSLTIHGGTLAIGDGKTDAFSLRGGVEWSGGAGTVFADGATRTAAQTLTLRDVVLNLRPESGAVESLEATATALTLTASLDSATRHLEITDSSLTTVGFQFIGRAAAAPKRADPGENAPDAAADRPPEGEEPGWLRSVTLNKLAAPKVEGEWSWKSAPAAPPLAGKVSAALAVSALRWTETDGLTGAEFVADHVAALVPGTVDAKNLTAAFSLGPDGPRVARLAVEGAAVTDPAALLPALGIDPAALPPLPKVSLLADAALTDLAFGADGARSAAVQEIVLRDVAATLPDESSARISRFRISASPDEFTSAGRVRAVEIEKPEIVWNGEAPVAATTAAPVAGAPVAPGGGPPSDSAARPLLIDTLKITGGTARVRLPETKGAVLTAGFHAGASAENPGDWLAEVTGLLVEHPGAGEAPLYTAEAVRVSAAPEDLWARRRIRSAEIVGSRLEIGAAFFRILKPASDAAEEPGPHLSKGNSPAPPNDGGERATAGSADTESPVWRLGRLVLDDTRVRLDNLGDGRRLEIPISRQVFNALPLDASALSAVDRVYQVEVPNITIFSPWQEGQKVAVLDSNYVRFSPSGILQRRLEAVELMSPSLYAGQPLFDYVEATRKRFAELAAVAGAPRPLLAAADKGNPAVLEAAASVRPSDGPPVGWVIPFYADSGKVIVAPKGNPWTDIPVFPFRNARGPDGKPVPFLLNGETFHGELAVAPGWYDFPEMKLRVRLSDRGRIVFNSPVKDQDNNLVEVFENNTVIWRQLQVEKVWLAVTYDKTGIYTRFGGETCGGYITGAVNLYLDELYTWDGSVSFTKINMKPITDKLTPEYFRMGGVVDELTVHAYGDMNSLYQASGTLKVSRPGKLEIIALDALREEMKDFGSLSRQIGEIGVDTLRSFDFTSCAGSLKLFGSEGTAELRLKGPEGSRNFNINLHDYRARLPKSAVRF